jgi:IclR family transcriptional regulator, acetate operon repressor
MMPATRRDYVISSLDDGLRVLMLFLRMESVTVTQAASVGITRSKAHRILSTLLDRGLIEMAPSRRGYVPGPALLEMALPLGLGPESRRLAHAVLDAVREEVDETAHAGVQVGSQVLIFDSRPSSGSDSIGSRMGQLRPAYCTSAGKLLLSRLSMKQLSVLFPEEQLLQYTPFTLATRDALFEELSRTAELDYAVNMQESELGICGVAVIMSGKTWRDRVSVHLSVQADHTSRSDLAALGEELKAIVAKQRRLHRRQ